MPNIPLSPLSVQYDSDQQISVRGWRWRADVQFIDQNGLLVPHRCIVDTGAPLSVIPFSLWSGRRLQSWPLGTQWKSRGRPVTGDLLWQGVDCQLRETGVFLVDATVGTRTGPHRLIGKFVLRPLAQRLEKLVVIGGNFLPDNGIDLVLRSSGGTTSGYFAVPSP